MPCKSGNLGYVVIDNLLASDSQRLLNAAMRHEWITVAVAADPRSKAHNLRYCYRRAAAENILKGVLQFVIEARQRIEYHHGEIIEAHVNLVQDSRPIETNFVGLPEFCNRGQYLSLIIQGISVRKR